MYEWFHFIVKKGIPADLAIQEISTYHVEEISLLEDLENKKTLLCGKANKEELPPSWKYIEQIILLHSDINWNEQWELFCPYFQKDLCKIPLSDFCEGASEELLLTPGPGFGDLSHPTTLLMMELIGTYAPKKTLIDLGCGSGILGLSALKLGANKVYCLDIADEALEHTLTNAKLNKLEDKLFAGKSLPSPADPAPEILLLNMTFQEQKEAIASLSLDQKKNLTWITSGILKKQKIKYLAFAKSLNLTLKSTISKDEWLAFIFSADKKKEA